MAVRDLRDARIALGQETEDFGEGFGPRVDATVLAGNTECEQSGRGESAYLFVGKLPTGIASCRLLGELCREIGGDGEGFGLVTDAVGVLDGGHA